MPGRRTYISMETRLRGVVETARKSCGMLVMAPGMLSFKLMDRASPAGGLWATGRKDAAQEQVVWENCRPVEVVCALQQGYDRHVDPPGARPGSGLFAESSPTVEGKGIVLMVRR